jgi:hypothetical protein
MAAGKYFVHFHPLLKELIAKQIRFHLRLAAVWKRICLHSWAGAVTVSRVAAAVFAGFTP